MAAAGDAAQQELALGIAEVLLPFTLENQQAVDLLPPGAIVPSQATYWCVEGASFALTKLVSGGGCGRQAASSWRLQQLNAVKETMPSHHSDPRYAFGICLAALDRAAAYATSGTTQSFQVKLWQRLDSCKARWVELYVENTGEDVPEDWLGGNKGGGIEWKELA